MKVSFIFKSMALALGLLLVSSVIYYAYAATPENGRGQTPLFASLNSPAQNCLEQVGKPYASGTMVYIKVKNTCDHIVVVDWEVGVFNFGIQAQRLSTQKGSVAIEPGQEAEICVPKPADPGDYCFHFLLKNRDQQQPDDRLREWLNDIRVVSLPHDTRQTAFMVGGSEFVSTTITLEPDLTSLPPGWQMNLSTYEIPPTQFPATVTWTVQVGDLAPGQVVTLTVNGYDQVQPSPVGWVNMVISHDPERVFLPVTMNGLAPAAGESPQPALSYAEAGSGRVAGQTLVFAWDEGGEGDVAQVSFAYQSGPAWVPIGDGADRPVDFMEGVWTVVWDTAVVPAGLYPLRVTMTDEGGHQAAAEMIVQVAKKPTALAEAQFLTGDILFDGSLSFDPDGTVAGWYWDFGDGQTGTGPMVSHMYTDPTQMYDVTLTVTDDHGYQSQGYYQVAPAETVFDVREDCGCDSMDIETEGTSDMHMWWLTRPLSRTLGAYNTIPSPLPAPPGGRYYVMFNFEVEAHLKPGSNPDLCVEGQWAKRTAHWDTTTGHKRHGGVNYPYAGGVLGPDNYTAPSSVKEHDGLNVRWVDGPGFGTPARNAGGLSRADVATSGDQGVTWNARFFAQVSGPAGTCSCSWEVTWTIAHDGSVVTPPQVVNENCS